MNNRNIIQIQRNMQAVVKDEKTIWKTTLAQIEIKLDAPAQFKTFFSETKLLRIENRTAYIGVPNPFTAEWLRTKYLQLIKSTLSYVYGEELEVDFTVYQKEIPKIPEEEIKKSSPILNLQNGVYGNLMDIITKACLNPKYHISNYVVGNSNRIAYAAAIAVIENPGQVYNPLFIHGKTGVGKTHLAQAIGRSIIERNPNKKVLYTTSEGFLNDMVKGIKTGQTELFRQKYRPVDVLIIDDIQLISKWVATQTEFFNTFNEMYNSGRQIIFVADRKPDDIQNIENRLRSRMNGGMVVDISPPDFETRLAILEKKAEFLGIYLKKNILEFIARTITENVRELEGMLQKVSLFNQLKGEEQLTLEEVAYII
ncbi:MAG: chromosomal replication initiator protein DnaA, partial [Candidatus Dojkabacteria bacterium]|nr:chromosomal replication initiator protein DnaA [Candidatus Dojkabacteria bacterium]